MDHLTPEQRSWNMSRIKGKDTKPEVLVRSMLHRAGYRFRKNVKTLPGKPDIVLPKYRTVIFVHGCFWHRHKGCKQASTPSTNVEFWQKKFERNVSNDRKHRRELKTLGWKVVTVWECQLKKPGRVVQRLENTLDNAATKLL
jgi:DNA mismatch endonuclease (patch repair protein)